MIVAGVDERGNRELQRKGYRASVMQNENVPELCYTTMSRLSTPKEEKGLPGGSNGKVSVYNAGDLGSIPGSGRSAGQGHGNPLQYYCLENPIYRGAW